MTARILTTRTLANARAGFYGFARTAAAASIFLGLFGAVGAAAAEAKNLGTFKYWTAWQGTDANGTICYISATPQTMLPTNVDHGDIHFLVIKREKMPVKDASGKTTYRSTKNEVQALMGYALKADPAPTASVDGKSYPMVVEGKVAWLASASDEPGFVAAMKAGKQLSVKATSARGTNTSYTYSLSGVTAALASIDKVCKW